MSRIHVIGAGLSGLAAAVRLAHLGPALTVYEAAPRAGGRARSYHDPQLGCVIDNGNHLILSGNSAIHDYLTAIGASDRLVGPQEAAFPFVDVQSGERWSVRPGVGRIPWWLLDRRRRVPGTSLKDYLSIARVLGAKPSDTMDACVGHGALARGFWEPLTIAVLNTAPETAAAILMAPVLRETVLKGADYCRPLIARRNLADTFVDPALKQLTNAGVAIRFGIRLRALGCEGNRVSTLDLDGIHEAVGPNDLVILAVPPWIAETLLPDLPVPPAGEPIVNVHYRLDAPLADAPKIVGLVGGLAQWVFARDDIASVTISAADAVVDRDADEIAHTCWPEVALALELGSKAMPPARVVKERRATFAQTPEALALRPSSMGTVANLLLAGDWTDTGLPATLEGAVRSGFTAAAHAEKMRHTNAKAA
jgi:squalene-associated FAD-dependent desaturase